LYNTGVLFSFFDFILDTISTKSLKKTAEHSHNNLVIKNGVHLIMQSLLEADSEPILIQRMLIGEQRTLEGASNLWNLVTASDPETRAMVLKIFLKLERRKDEMNDREDVGLDPSFWKVQNVSCAIKALSDPYITDSAQYPQASSSLYFHS
jgi:hypothetical protein